MTSITPVQSQYAGSLDEDHTSVITHYISCCCACLEVSPPMPLHLVVDWARSHNRNEHGSALITRRCKFDKRVQRSSWKAAKRALNKLGHQGKEL